jgi:hypothetical protein
MNTPDQDLVLRALEDARQILAEYEAVGDFDGRRTIGRLFVLLDREDLLHAMDRIKRRRVLRLVE